MKILDFKLFYLLAIIFVFMSCNNDLDLIDPQGDIPVIYALINNGSTDVDTAQYFRVERAFIDADVSALEIAQNPDSIYYSNAVVRLRNLDNDQTYQLERVDGNLEGYVRDQGVFAQAPNYLYKIKNTQLPLIEGNQYQLEVERGNELPLVTAQTTLIEKPRITKPNAGSVLSFPEIGFATFRWLGDENSTIHDATLIFNYLEFEGTNFEEKSVKWTIAKNSEETEIDQEGLDFYGFLSSSIDANPAKQRQFMSIDFVVTSGDQDIADYVNVVSANLGITSSQDIPTFTNLSEGYGLFSNIATSKLLGVGLSPITLDSIRDGRFTKDLNFL